MDFKLWMKTKNKWGCHPSKSKLEKQFRVSHISCVILAPHPKYELCTFYFLALNDYVSYSISNQVKPHTLFRFLRGNTKYYYNTLIIGHNNYSRMKAAKLLCLTYSFNTQYPQELYCFTFYKSIYDAWWIHIHHCPSTFSKTLVANCFPQLLPLVLTISMHVTYPISPLTWTWTFLIPISSGKSYSAQKNSQLPITRSYPVMPLTPGWTTQTFSPFDQRACIAAKSPFLKEL